MRMMDLVGQLCRTTLSRIVHKQIYILMVICTKKERKNINKEKSDPILDYKIISKVGCVLN